MEEKKGVFGTKEWASHSINFQSGCENDCLYCLSGDTLILMYDGTSKLLKDIKIGDRIIGVREKNKYHYYTETKVMNIWETIKPAIKIVLDNGVEIICSSDHRWLTDRGWKYTIGAMSGKKRRPYLTTNNHILGNLDLYSPFAITNLYMKGYLSGMIKGDGLLKHYNYSGRRRGKDEQYQFRLALIDKNAVKRSFEYLNEFNIQTNWFDFKMGKDFHDSIRTNTKNNFQKIKRLIRLRESREFKRGFLAGIFDAEGSFSENIFRISNTNDTIIDFIKKSLTEFDFKYCTEPIKKRKGLKPLEIVRIKGGLTEYVKFFQIMYPAIKRKFKIKGNQVKSWRNRVKIKKIIPLNKSIEMRDITTGSRTFIANGYVSHNCYAKEGAIKRGHNSADEWNDSRIREKAVKKVRRKLDGTIMIPTTHDITPSNVKEAVIVFEKLLKAGNDLLIVSKPHKECIKEICDSLRNYKEQILFRFTIGSTSDDVLSFWEPKAPAFKERLESLKMAYFAGYKTSVSSEPMLDGNIDRVVFAVEDYVTDSIWIGKMNQCVNRVKTNGHDDTETLRKLDSLMQFQNHKPNIIEIYNQFKLHPKVKWKESIKKIVGIKVPTEAGLDI